MVCLAFREDPLSGCVVRALTALALAGAWPAASHAQADQPFRRWYTYDYVVRSSELIDFTSRNETEVIAPSMVQSLGQHRLTINTHFFDLEIIEAATIKPDGRRIDVQRDRINVPRGIKLSRANGEYESTYSQSEGSLRVSRRLVWRMPSQVCTREIANQLRDLAVAAARDFNSRLRIVDVGFNGPYNDDPSAEAPD
jgi:hypothetical protein